MRILVAVLACCMLVLTGCGDDPDEVSRRNTHGLSQSPKASRSPSATTTWSVVGVQRGDVLNVRRAPAADAPILARLRPLATGVQVTQRTSGAWRQVRVDGRTGWAHGRYLGILGKAVTITSEARAIGIAPTRAALVRKVAGRQAEAGEGPLVGPVLVARKGDAFTSDVLGYADDSVRGERFSVQVVPGEAGFEVRRATAAPICARGVNDSGLCL